MSLGGSISQALDDAVIAAAATGVRFALAAGNESDDADSHSPARAEGPNIFTVSAFDSAGNFIRKAEDPDAHQDVWLEGMTKKKIQQAAEAKKRQEENEERVQCLCCGKDEWASSLLVMVR